MKTKHVLSVLLVFVLFAVFGAVIQDLTIVRKLGRIVDQKVNELTVDLF